MTLSPRPPVSSLHPTIRSLVADLRLDPGVEPTLRISVRPARSALGGTEARAVGGLPDGRAERGRGDATRTSPAVAFGCPSGRSSSRVRRRLSCSSTRSAGPRPSSPAPTWSSTPMPGSACSRRAPPTADAHVIAIETSRSAVNDARENLGRPAYDLVRGEVGGWHAPAGLEVDVVIADPARSGLGAPGRAALMSLAPRCWCWSAAIPASLGRDAKLLGRGLPPRPLGGDRHVPQTTHVEVVSTVHEGLRPRRCCRR